MRYLLIVSVAVGVSACAPDVEPTAGGSATANSSAPNSSKIAAEAQPVAPGGTAERAPRIPEPAPTARDADLPLRMPLLLRGAWRADDLDRAPTGDDCNQTAASNRNFGKVLTIREDGYNLFEDGGRLITVHARSNDMIDATFDTTYADTPTQARIAFTAGPADRLKLTGKDASAQVSARAYRRCPA